MFRPRSFLAALLFLSLTLRAEEITLKDGSKITGKVVGVSEKVFEVDSTYGHLQVPRQEIVSIIFTQNQPQDSEAAVKPPKKVDDEVQGSRYINRTGMFTLAIPAGWDKKPDAISGELIGVVGDQLHFAAVVQEHYDGTLKNYKAIIEVEKPTRLIGYQKVDESETTIDGHPAALFSFTGTIEKAKNIPMHFEMAIVGYENGEFVQIVAWTIEPFFVESRPMFEKVLHSYQRLPAKPTPSPSAPK